MEEADTGDRIRQAKEKLNFTREQQASSWVLRS